jgi:hypothetical protein
VAPKKGAKPTSKQKLKPAKRGRASKRPRKRTQKPAAQGTDFLDERMSKAFGHTLRVNIMAAASWRKISPSDYARESGEKLGRVSWHFQQLVKYDALEEVGKEQVRGSVKHFYRGTRRAIFGGAGWENLPKSVQDGIAGAALQDFMRVAVRSIESGTFSTRDDSYFTWDPLKYDELALKAAAKILEATRRRLLALQDEAMPRLAKTGQDGILVAISLAGFEMHES